MIPSGSAARWQLEGASTAAVSPHEVANESQEEGHTKAQRHPDERVAQSLGEDGQNAARRVTERRGGLGRV